MYFIIHGGSLASCRFLVAFSIPIIHEMRGMAVDANRSKSHLSLPGLCFFFVFFFFWGGGGVCLTKAALNKGIISISAAN